VIKKPLANRCMGECCMDIGLYVSPKELEISYIFWLSREKYGNKDFDISKSMHNDRFSNIKNIKLYNDIHLLYPMLEFLKEDNYHPEEPTKKLKETIYHYSCKHFDRLTRLCTIYNIRPLMCRTYPDNGFCRNPRCRWKKQIKLRKAHEKKLKKEKLKKEENRQKKLTKKSQLKDVKVEENIV